MRVLHLVNHLRDVGNGITNVTVDLAVGQRLLGHDVVVASSGGEFTSLLAEHGVGISSIDFANRTISGLASSRRKLRHLVRDYRPDVIHSHTITPAVLAATVRSGASTVATAHNEYQRGVRLMALADRVVGVSAAVSNQLIQRGLESSKSRTVANGPVGTVRRGDDFEPIGCDAPRFVAVGAVSPRKGSDVVLDAFLQVAALDSAVEMFFVGADHFPGLEAKARASGFSNRVTFVGFDANPQRYMDGARALVLASRREPFGLVAVEAQSFGTPVIGSDIEGIPEALDWGRAGLLVPVDDADELAKAMVRILKDEELRAQLSVNAIEHASRRTTAVMVKEYLTIYTEAIDGRD